MSTGGYVMRLEGEITIVDSAYSFQFMGKYDQWKVSKSTSSSVYITDGMATDRLTITSIPGNVKGYAYDYTFIRDQDSKYQGKQIIYYCRKKP
jgi:hypothetical protein